MRAGDVANRELVIEVCAAALAACRVSRWPDRLPREHARAMVYEYLRDHSAYFEETDLQVIRMPRALVIDGVGDCKSTAIFAAALLHAAGCRVALRFIRQPGRPWWSHVYAVADGVAVDPLLPLGHEAPATAVLEYAIP
jgi:hypothetical protein